MQKTAAQHISKVTTPQQQRSFFGNKKDPRFFAPALIQPKLTIAPVNDPYEVEADAVADKVMRMPDTTAIPQANPSHITIQRKCEACDQEEKLHRKEDEDEEHIQLKPANDYTIQRQCASCEEEHDIHRKENEYDSHVQLKPANNYTIQRQCAGCEHEEQEINRKEAAPSATPAVTPAVQQSLQSHGRSLDAGTRSFMETRFGYDFGDVQVHNDSLAHQSSKDIKARAYTHGKDIVFGEGQYQPETYAGKQLLAHELTHVVQQNGMVSRKPDDENTDLWHKMIDTLAPMSYGTPMDSDRMLEIDILGDKKLKIPDMLEDYVYYYVEGRHYVPMKIKYGNFGSGVIFLECNVPVFREVCTRDISFLPIIPLYLASDKCHFEFSVARSFFSARYQLIPIKLPNLDTSTRPGTLVLNVDINSNEIFGKVGWLPGVDYAQCDTMSDYQDADFSHSALLPFIYGKDYQGDNFKEDHYDNRLDGGTLNILSLGELSLPNLQKIQGIFQTGDGDKIWNTTLVTNVKGADEYRIPIDRTDKGVLSGQGEGIKLNGKWTDKGFNVQGTLHSSFVNSKLFVIGKVHYHTDRSDGDLFLAVTDYMTAKKYAIEYLPDEIGALASLDEQPDNPNEQLAFVGAGNIKLTLFNGRHTETPRKPGTGDVKLQKSTPGKPRPAEVNASFVVEPEGYITVAGEISQPTGEFELFGQAKYWKDIPLIKIPAFYMPGPAGTGLEVDIGAALRFGAEIGPLTLSQLRASGIYSNRPEKIRELELSGFMQLDGGIFAALVISISLNVDVALFSIEVFSKDIVFEANMTGSIYARPTIKIRSSDTKTEKPREYSITGNFDFNVGAGLSYQIQDRVKADATEKKPKDGETAKKYKYIEATGGKKDSVPEGDIKVPIDESLNAEIPPPAIWAKDLEDSGFVKTLKQVMKGERPGGKTFVEGVSDAFNPSSKKTDTTFQDGRYKEHGQNRTHVKPPLKAPDTGPDIPENLTYTFEKAFHMKIKDHKLYLLVDMVRNGEKISNVVVRLLMASDVAEDIEEKIIREETQLIAAPAGPAADFQEDDLDRIYGEVRDVKKDIKQLAENNQISENAVAPQLAPLAAEIERYAERTDELDLGDQGSSPAVAAPQIPAPAVPAAPVPEPANPATNTKTQPSPKVCSVPKNVSVGDDIVFLGRNNEDLENGVVQQIYVYEDDAKKDNWLIRFKPKTGRNTTSLSKRAYDENCDPTYRIPIKAGAFKPHIISDPIPAPTRYVGGKSYYSFKKAKTIEAYPLRWGTYLDPKVDIVGMDRINTARAGKWHRAHLVDGDLGGPGRLDNLVPASQYVNTVKMTKHEDHLEGLVKKGDMEINKVYYWFSAVVNYYDDTENKEIGYFSDFVKSVDVSYGIAEPKDKTKAIDELREDEWDRTNRDKYQRTVDFDDEPETLDIKSSRAAG